MPIKICLGIKRTMFLLYILTIQAKGQVGLLLLLLLIILLLMYNLVVGLFEKNSIYVSIKTDQPSFK